MSKRITGVRPISPPNLNRKTSWKDDILRDYTHIINGKLITFLGGTSWTGKNWISQCTPLWALNAELPQIITSILNWTSFASKYFKKSKILYLHANIHTICIHNIIQCSIDYVY